MRLIKTPGLVAIAVMVTFASLSASSASADDVNILICKFRELICLNPTPSPTTLVGHAQKPKISTSIGTVECEKSLMEITVLNAPLDALKIGHLLALSTEGNCHLGSTSCTVTTTSLGLDSVTKLGPLRALFTSTGGTETNVKCGFLINCTYGGETVLEGSSKESGESTIEANGATLTKSAGFCPETSKWFANYIILGSLWYES